MLKLRVEALGDGDRASRASGSSEVSWPAAVFAGEVFGYGSSSEAPKDATSMTSQAGVAAGLGKVYAALDANVSENVRFVCCLQSVAHGSNRRGRGMRA
jgi:hypothetical protein